MVLFIITPPSYAKDKTILNLSQRIAIIKKQTHSTVKKLDEKPRFNPFKLNSERNQNKTQHNVIRSTLVQIHYLKAKDIEKVFTQNKKQLLSKQGIISVINTTNSIWIRDAPEKLAQIKNIIKQLDRPSPQILIKARIVNVDDSFVKSLGVIFATQTKKTQNEDGFKMNLPFAASGIGKITIPIIKLKNDTLLDLQLTALEKEGHAKLISSPELLTTNRQAAIIESGEEIPYQEKTGTGNTSVAFKKAVLRLKVTPILLPHKRIYLHLQVNQDKVSALTVNGVPAIRTQQLSTQVVVKNQQTFVLGGIYEQLNSQQQEGVPVLKNIPIVGALFRHHERKTSRRELLIFVTPRIIQ